MRSPRVGPAVGRMACPLLAFLACAPCALAAAPPAAAAVPGPVAVAVWSATGDARAPFAPLPSLSFTAGGGGSGLSLQVNDASLRQEMAGFGGTMTDSSAYALDANRDSAGNPMLPDAPSQPALDLLFSPTKGIGLDYVRVPIGGNDFSQQAYSAACNQSNASCSSLNNYTADDVPGDPISEIVGDPWLTRFSLGPDAAYLIPTLAAARRTNPSIQFLASPWSAPAWMKCVSLLVVCVPGIAGLDGGTLRPGYELVYAQYLLKVVQAYAARGVDFAAITIDNEPFNANPSPAYPVMTLSLAQQELVTTYLGVLLASAGLTTKILGLDHNWDYAGQANALLSSPAGPYVAGIAFHCYGGDPVAQLSLPAAEPIYQTECSPSGSYRNPPADLATSPGSYAADLAYNTLQQVIQSVQYGSRTVMLYNIAANQNYGPTINPACYGTPTDNCLALMAVAGSGAATPGVGYYVLGDVSRFVAPGAHRIDSTLGGGGPCAPPPGNAGTGEPRHCVWSVAFKNTDGRIVVVALNISSATAALAVQWHGASFATSIPAGEVRTYVWAAG